ncbi:hypothetical protein NA57DRAFT_72441 [Rhizodiscina lignyota]|uniref:Uncharacterized protein n=1 Tax=Rhizodiscina lignyota TaxID=1504668 RepID=A0A9P4MA97_9PEZI|nr:hypothetical protein NA57DRAFT_72441 [Rhizodiscina lignyota]
MSVYHIPDLSYEYMEALYDAGFYGINDLDYEGRTPLDVFWHKLHNIEPTGSFWDGHFPGWDRSHLKRFNWLVSKGATIQYFSTPSSWTHLHMITTAMPDFYFSELGNLLSEAVQNEVLKTDTCNCYCSTKGCLALNVYLKRRVVSRFSMTLSLSTGRQVTNDWIKTFQLEPHDARLHYQEACRLEIFNRLDMAHTCCTKREFKLNEADIEELQSEDSYAHAQLELIMSAYAQALERHSGTIIDFWDDWWNKVDRILPENEDRPSYWDVKNWEDGWEVRRKDSVFPRPEYKNEEFIQVILRELFDPSDVAQEEEDFSSRPSDSSEEQNAQS